jgi:hypothetical protein
LRLDEEKISGKLVGGGGRNFNNLGPKIDDGDGVQANAETF